MAAFGSNVQAQAGAHMLVLSSGRARTPAQLNACGAFSCTNNNDGTAPSGFPQDVPGCTTSATIRDDVALALTLKAPSNATGFSFDFRFYSFEYPQWVCAEYNDQFVALMTPAAVGSVDGNLSFDAQGSRGSHRFWNSRLPARHG